MQARLEERENERKESTERKRRGPSLTTEASHPHRFDVKGVDQHGEVIVMRCIASVSHVHVHPFR